MSASNSGLMDTGHVKSWARFTEALDAMQKGLERQTGPESAAMWGRVVFGPLTKYLMPDIVLAQGKVLQSEVQRLIEKGCIKRDVFDEQPNLLALSEILKMVENGELNDEELFRAVKSIFYSSLISGAGEYQKRRARSFLSLCRRISTDDLLILRAAYELAVLTVPNDEVNANKWRVAIANKTGLSHKELIEAREEGLMDERLISDYLYKGDNSGFMRTDHYRLTNLGFEFCEFFVRFREDQI